VSEGVGRTLEPLPNIVHADNEEPLFKAGDSVKIAVRFPIGHYRVPNYIRGKRGRVEAVIEPRAVNNEEEGFGRNVGLKRHYYRIAIPLTELWPNYAGSPNDGLRIEVFENWLEKR
jgi:nitrile hydratase subunit beta